MMEELINVNVNEEGIKVVSARELHGGLSIKGDYTDWMKRMISYGFEKDEDFTLLKNKVGKVWVHDHAITLDMAKQICMIQRTDEGKRYRQYFIECEKENKVLNTIIDNTSDEQAKLERNQFRFSMKRTITTFENCNALELPKLIEDFNEYIATLDTDTRLTRYKSAIKGIERINRYINETNVYMLPMILVEKEKLIKAHHKLENNRNGGIKAGKTKQIARLEQEMEDMAFDENNLIWLDYHGFSVNSMYEDNKKTYAYKTWEQRFPYVQLEPFHNFHDRVDITKPMKMYLRFGCMPKYDLDNMVKSIQDRLANRYGFNDVMIVEHDNKIVGRCESYSEGKIGYWIENVGE